MIVKLMIATRGSPVGHSGALIGPFVVHRMDECFINRSVSLQKWGVTHAATGYSAAFGPTKACCESAAKRLSEVGVNWDFTDPMAVKEFRKDKLKAIGVIRAACAQGGFA